MISEERLAEIRGLHGERRHVASDCMMCDLLRDRDALAAENVQGATLYLQIRDEAQRLAARVEVLEKIETAAERWSHWGKVKVMHVLTCGDCKRLEGSEGRWCDEAKKIGRAQLDAAKALNAALARRPAEAAHEVPDL